MLSSGLKTPVSAMKPWPRSQLPKYLQHAVLLEEIAGESIALTLVEVARPEVLEAQVVGEVLRAHVE
eukprot:206682-Alexandrium_andersonii.AAC.1